MPILGWKLTAIWQNFNAEDKMGGGQKLLTFKFLFALEIIALPFFFLFICDNFHKIKNPFLCPIWNSTSVLNSPERFKKLRKVLLHF